MEQFYESLKLVKKHKNLALYVFYGMIFFAVIGFIFPSWFSEEVKQIVDTLLGLVEGKSLFELIWFITFNNVKVAFFAILMGVFGFLPIIAVVLNGYLLGAVFNAAVAEEGLVVLWKLFPHGIFEIPALCIAFAFSLRVFFALFNKEDIFQSYKEAFKVFLFVIVPLLVIAGIIEGLLVFYLG